jgi:hypothetical protein
VAIALLLFHPSDNIEIHISEITPPAKIENFADDSFTLLTPALLSAPTQGLSDFQSS